LAGAGGGAAGVDVRWAGDGLVPAGGAAGAPEPQPFGGRAGDRPVVRGGNRQLSGGRGDGRRAVRVAGRPPGPRAGDEPQRAHLCLLQRRLRTGPLAGAGGGLALRLGPGNGRRVGAGRGPRHGNLARPLARDAGRLDWGRIQCGLRPDRPPGADSGGRSGAIAALAVADRIFCAMGRDPDRGERLAAADVRRGVAGTTRPAHSGLRSRIAKMETGAVPRLNVALGGARPVGRARRGRGRVDAHLLVGGRSSLGRAARRVAGCDADPDRGLRLSRVPIPSSDDTRAPVPSAKGKRLFGGMPEKHRPNPQRGRESRFLTRFPASPVPISDRFACGAAASASDTPPYGFPALGPPARACPRRSRVLRLRRLRGPCR